MLSEGRKKQHVLIPKHICCDRQHINGCLGVREEGRKGLHKRKKGNFWGDGYVHYS